MADYYPILARTIACLPQNDAEARQDVYARARSIVAEQLRGRGLRNGATEALREQAALESAIRKIEAESQPAPARRKNEPRRPAQRVAVSPAQAQATATAGSLSKILQAVQPGDGPAPRGARKAKKGATAFAPAVEPQVSRTSEAESFNESAELGGAPSSLVTLLFATAYIVAALAFTGVTYIRGVIWLYQGVIGYPILLAIMAVTLALFIVPPVIVLRRSSALPSVDVLLRYIHSASRRAL